LATTIIGLDLLLKSTHENSVLHEIVAWPLRDFFKTASVALCALAIYELRHEDKEEAFVSSALAVSCLLIDPVYRYHRVNEKIGEALIRVFRTTRQVFDELVLVPLAAILSWTKWLILLEWMPGLLHHISGYWDFMRKSMEERVIRPVAAFIRYWLCFYWLVDLKAWTQRRLLNPTLERMNRLLEKFIYVAGCYWLRPVLIQLRSICWQATRSLLVCIGQILRQATFALGLYVFEPALIVVVDQLKEFYWLIHRIAIRPALDTIYVKYKFVEDLIFIHVLGPFFQKIVENVPEKNPFCEDSDAEFDDFVPPGDSNKEGNNDEGESDNSLTSGASILSSNDELRFPTRKDLSKINLEGSDSSEDEFLPCQRSLSARRLSNKRISHKKSPKIS